jgi:hypothetical protein
MVPKEKEALNKRKRKMMHVDDPIDTKKSKDSVVDSLIRIEIFKKNDKTFDGRLCRGDILKVWSEALRRDRSEVEGFASIQIRGRALRVNFRLKKPVAATDLFKKPEFEWEKIVNGQCDFFSGKVLGLSSKVNIGDVVTVCINRTALEFSDVQLARWLEVFGKIEGNFKYHSDSEGFKTDEIEVELKLQRHIPEYLPMYGRRIRIFYIGMQKQCNNCLELGHIKPECESEKRDWFSFIEELIESKDFKKELFGEWPEIIKNKRNQAKSQNAGDKTEKKGAKNFRGRGRGRGRGK